ncbi:zf-HC2 domain-containing protein [bacterium]|nr:zf-HC2 domain-containing protein [bacterium]
MKCLKADQIYLYLEGELSAEEASAVRFHLASCPSCQKAVEEREHLNQACKELPLGDLPTDFTPRVMRKIFPEKVSFRSWLRALAGGLASFVVFSLLFLFLSASPFLPFLTAFYRAPLNLVQDISLVLVKIFKLLTLLIKVFLQLISLFTRGFMSVFTLIQPEIQISLTLFFLIFFFFFFYKIKRKFLIGENA